MGWEGFHSDDLTDKGGDTYFGISRVHHPEVQPWPPTFDQAKAFYKANYWDTMSLDAVASERAAWKVFDIGVNMGVKTAARFVQYILAVVMDGMIGPKTLAAFNLADESVMLGRLSTMQHERYATIINRDPTQQKFANGWFRRAVDIAEDWT